MRIIQLQLYFLCIQGSCSFFLSQLHMFLDSHQQSSHFAKFTLYLLQTFYFIEVKLWKRKPAKLPDSKNKWMQHLDNGIKSGDRNVFPEFIKFFHTA